MPVDDRETEISMNILLEIQNTEENLREKDTVDSEEYE